MRVRWVDGADVSVRVWGMIASQDNLDPLGISRKSASKQNKAYMLLFQTSISRSSEISNAKRSLAHTMSMVAATRSDV